VVGSAAGGAIRQASTTTLTREMSDILCLVTRGRGAYQAETEPRRRARELGLGRQRESAWTSSRISGSRSTSRSVISMRRVQQPLLLRARTCWSLLAASRAAAALLSRRTATGSGASARGRCAWTGAAAWSACCPPPAWPNARSASGRSAHWRRCAVVARCMHGACMVLVRAWCWCVHGAGACMVRAWCVRAECVHYP